MKKIFVFILFIVFKFCVGQKTPFEKSLGTETATYFEAINFYNQLDKQSDIVSVKAMGESDAGYPLHLVMVSANKNFNPELWHKQNKIIIFINNGIHPGEPDGIDASMMLVRDIANKKIVLPNNVVLTIIPIYNIGGALNRNSFSRVNQNGPISYGFRGNSQNLDLNRDFTKCDSKEAKTFTQIFHWLKPNIFLDNHVSDGADFQHTMTLITTQYDKLGKPLSKTIKELEKEIYANMKIKNWDMIPYVEFENANLQKGIPMFNETPRYSSGYTALFGTLSFISETHMLKPFKDRVQATYDLMQTFILTSAQQSKTIIAAQTNAANLKISQKEFALKWVVDTNAIADKIVFKGYEQDSTLSQATGLKKMFYNHAKPYTKEIFYNNTYKAQNIVSKPIAYIIPSGWHQVIERLLINNVTISKLKNDTSIFVTTQYIDDYKSRTTPYEKHHVNYGVKVKFKQDTIRFLAGDHIIYLNQTANRYIVEMLEPTGDDSFFAWNFFDAILQQKEGYSDYRWEDVAAEYLKSNTALQNKLIEKKNTDKVFANSSAAILDFIYKQSPYYEPAHRKYPVYRIE
jgi:hypothetical protein